jgi:catechol 2,3-dioxygenase-like lactoylglutathione lyase family enzyme
MQHDADALLAPQFAEIVRLTEQPFFQPIYDVESPQLVFGRVVLVGDAAFVARPHVGMGVTKAAGDAVALADALHGNDDIHEALRHYEEARVRFGATVIARARHLGAYMQAQIRTTSERQMAERYRTPAAVMRETAMPVEKLDHYSIRTLDLRASERFYTQIMGFTIGFRPPFKFPGLWLYNGGSYPDTLGVVHIIGVDPNDPEGLKEYLGDRDVASLKGTGTVDHMAFRATGLSQMRAKLKQAAIPYRERTVPSLSLHQVFVEDPSDVTIELNYPASEAEQPV